MWRFCDGILHISSPPCLHGSINPIDTTYRNSVFLMNLKDTALSVLMYKREKHNVCAITTYKGRVTAIATNSYTKSHPEQKRLATKVGHPSKQYLHAEIAALLRADRVDAIHVFRINKRLEFVNAKPCAICELGIAERNITRIFHT